ncbi:MAG: hypothetical protein IJY01_00530 [Clostridia bacterium]|nr:hypothetical protein [Clostridia bacterium]
MKYIEKLVVIFDIIFFLLMCVVISFEEPIFIYIAVACVIIGGPIVVAFAFISAPYHNDKESEDTEEENNG